MTLTEKPIQPSPMKLDYSALGSPRASDRWLGSLACVLGVGSTLLVLYLSHEARMSMVQARTEWCGTPAARAEATLFSNGLLIIVPAVAYWLAWYAEFGKSTCRVALAVSVCGWLVYVFSRNATV
jgi:hypothetical protein